jgi:hypothetical protein
MMKREKIDEAARAFIQSSPQILKIPSHPRVEQRRKKGTQPSPQSKAAAVAAPSPPSHLSTPLLFPCSSPCAVDSSPQYHGLAAAIKEEENRKIRKEGYGLEE